MFKNYGNFIFSINTNINLQTIEMHFEIFPPWVYTGSNHSVTIFWSTFEFVFKIIDLSCSHVFFNILFITWNLYPLGLVFRWNNIKKSHKAISDESKEVQQSL